MGFGGGGYGGRFGGGGGDSHANANVNAKGAEAKTDIVPDPNDTAVVKCKRKVESYEKCGIFSQRLGGKAYCLPHLDDLEASCAQYKAFWGSWWENELKPKHCERHLHIYKRVNRNRGKLWNNDPLSGEYRKEVEEICGIISD